MAVTNFPNGISSFGMPLIGITTGNVWFVDDSGSNGNSGSDPDNPFADLDYAIGRCTANKGDLIILMPGHAETATAIAMDVAGVRVVGLGTGADRPTITATTAAADLIDITAASCHMENIILVGGASGTTALVDIGAAADCSFKNMVFRHGAAPTEAVTVSGVAPRLVFDSCKWHGTANGPTVGVSFESATENSCLDFEFVDCVFNYGLYGLDTAAITNKSAGTQEGGIIRNCVFSGMDATAVDFNSSSNANPRGLITDCRAMARAGITIANIYDLASYGIIESFGTDGCSVTGAHVPALSTT